MFVKLRLSGLLRCGGWVSFLLACPILLTGCNRIFTPDFETDLVEMKSGQYALARDHASLVFKINHLGFSNYIGRFNAFDGSLDFDPANVQNSSLEVIIDMASIDVNNPEFARELCGEDWLNVERYPQAVFRTTQYLESTAPNRFVFEGDLTFHGVTAPVILNVNFNGGGRNFLTRKNTLGFSASANFKRSEFGVDNFVSFGVGDDIELEVHVEFQQNT